MDRVCGDKKLTYNFRKKYGKRVLGGLRIWEVSIKVVEMEGFCIRVMDPSESATRICWNNSYVKSTYDAINI